LRCEVEQRSFSSKVDNHPFGKLVSNPQNDLRLSSCGLNMFDFTKTYTVADFFQTNKENQPYYERLSNGKTQQNNYRAFQSVKTGISKRENVKQYTRLAIEYHRRKNTFTWFADGRKIHQVTQVGIAPKNMNIILDIEGLDNEVDIENLSCGFGCFTALDTTDPLDKNSQSGLIRLTTDSYYKPTAFPIEVKDNRLWGQGANVDRKSFKVTLRNDNSLV